MLDGPVRITHKLGFVECCFFEILIQGRRGDAIKGLLATYNLIYTYIRLRRYRDTEVVVKSLWTKSCISTIRMGCSVLGKYYIPTDSSGDFEIPP